MHIRLYNKQNVIARKLQQGTTQNEVNQVVTDITSISFVNINIQCGFVYSSTGAEREIYILNVN